MAVYLKMEESIVDLDNGLKSDFMGVSLLALLISPWAVLGLTISMLGYATLSTEVILICVAILLAAMPKLVQLMAPHQEKSQ